MTSKFSSRSTNLAKILGLSPEFATYLEQEVRGKRLESKLIQESGQKLSITFTFGNKNQNQIDHDQLSRQTPTSQKKTKKKSPSRLRRDRERFKKYLERKKQHKQQLSRHKPELNLNSNLPQCPPPPDELVTTPCGPEFVLTTSPPPELPPASSDDSWITVSDNSPLDRPSRPSELSPHSSSPACVPPPSPDTLGSDRQSPTTEIPSRNECICDLCLRFNNTDPMKQYHLECGQCGTPATEAHPLKPCSKCMMCAYCNKECQRKAWPIHKLGCDEAFGIKAREMRSTWETVKEIWLKHKLEPLLLPTD